MNLSAASNADIESAAQDYRDQQLANHLSLVEECKQPTLAEFIQTFTANSSFTTPVGSVDTGHFMEMLSFSTRQDAHDAIQMEALKGDPKTTMTDAAQNWFKLVKLMNEAAADYYEEHIADDYE